MVQMESPSERDRKAFDISQMIDDNLMSPLQIVVLMFCAAVMIFDGFDVQLITFAAPVLVDVLHISRAMLAPVFAAGLFGTMLGAFLFGPLADCFGRKLALIGCIGLFGLCSLGTVTASTVNEFYLWRFAGGLGLGGATPIAVALTSEYCPKRLRSTLVMIMYCGYSLGAALGGVLSAYLLPAFGWKSIFLIGGVVPLAIVLAMMAAMPESISYLVLTDKARTAIRDIVRRIAPHVAVDEAVVFTVKGDAAKGFPIRDLFMKTMLPKTITLWVMFFTNIVSLYFLVSWFPTLINTLGVPVQDAVLSSTMIQIGSMAGTLSISVIVRRIEAFRLLSLGYLGGAVSLVALSLLAHVTTILPALAFLAGYFVIGTQTAANAIGALVYPTSMRSTGIGWALGVGRIGSILGPSIGGLLVALHWSASDLFLSAAVPAVLAMCAALGMSYWQKRYPLAGQN